MIFYRLQLASFWTYFRTYLRHLLRYYVKYSLKAGICYLFVDKMDTSTKGEESSSNKDTKKDKKNEEAKEPELVSIYVLELLGVYDCLLISFCRCNVGYTNTLCHPRIK